MKQLRCHLVLVVTVLAMQAHAVTNAPAQAAADLGSEWGKWFAPDTTLVRLEGAPYPVFAVVASGGKTTGWVFRTDRVPPVVRGKRGEIGVLVGLGTDGLIKGIKVVQQQEDPAWFNRLKAGFYAQFTGRPANGSGPKVDTVATATVSSKAIVDDVFKSSSTVLALPAVKSQLNAAPAQPSPMSDARPRSATAESSTHRPPSRSSPP